jgi:hypothetical protein
MFYITATEYGQTFNAEIFATFDDACAFLDSLELAQDLAYSYSRECAISEVKQQIVDFMTENQES